MKNAQDVPKIVLIDDDLSIRLVIRQLIGRMLPSVKIFTSAEGVEGLGYIFAAKPRVIIVDTTLPKYGGLEVVEYVSSNLILQQQNTKILVLHEEKHVKLSRPECCVLFNKKDPDFLEKLLVEISRTIALPLAQDRVTQMMLRVGKSVVRYADLSDTLAHSLIKAPNILKPVRIVLWLLAQVITSIYHSLFVLLTNRDKEENVLQVRQDLQDSRIKIIPGLAVLLTSIILIACQLSAVLAAIIGSTRLATVNVVAANYTWDGGGDTGSCGAGNENNWSCAQNWSADIVPTSSDTAVFDGTSTKDAIVDAGFGGVITALDINVGYTGTITLQRSLQTTSTLSDSFNQDAGTFTAGANNLDVDGHFLLGGGIFNAPSTTLFAGSVFTISGGTFNHSNGTVTFDRNTTAALTCNGTTFNIASFTHTGGIKTVNSDCTFPLGDNPNANSGGSITLVGTLSGTGTLTTSGTLTFNAGAALSGFTNLAAATITVAGGTINLSGYTSVTTSAAFNISSGTFTGPNSPGTMTVTTTFSQTGGTFNHGSGLVTITGTFTINNAGAVFTGGAGNLDLNSTAAGSFALTAGTLTAPSGTMFVAGGFTISSGTTFNHNNGTITFDSTGTQSISCDSRTFNLVTFAHTANTRTVNASCNLPLGNNPTLGSGTASVTLNGTLSGTGTLTTLNTFTFQNGASLSGFSGLVASTLTLTAATASNHLNLSGYTTVDINGAFNLNTPTNPHTNTFTAPSGTMTAASTFTLASGTTFNHNNGHINFDGGTNATITCNGATFNSTAITISNNIKTVSSGCDLPLGNDPAAGTSSGSITLNGTLTGTGTLTTTGTFTLNSTAVLSGFNGLATSALVINGYTANFGSYSTFSAGSTVCVAGTNTTCNVLSTGSLTLPNGADLNGALIIPAGTFNAPSGTMTLAGALTISGAPTFNHNNGTITFDGGTATLSCNGMAFNLVTFNNSNTKTINSNCTLPLGSNPTLAGSGAITVAGGTLSGTGTLTKSSSTFRLEGSSVLSGFTAASVSGLQLAGATLDASSYTSFSASGTVILSAGSFTSPNSPATTSLGAFTYTGGTFNAGSGDISFTSTFSQTGGTFNASSGNITVASTFVINNAGAVFNGGAGNLDINSTAAGSFTFTTGSFTAPSGTLSVAGGFTISSGTTFNHNNGTITFDGASGSVSISCDNRTFNLVTIANTGGTKTINSNCTLPLGNNPTLGGVGGNITVNGTLSGTGTVTTPGTTGTLTMNTGSVLSGFTGYVGGKNLTIAGATIDFGSYTTVDFNNTLLMSSGTFTAPSGTMTLAASLTLNGGTFNHNNGTLIFDGQGTHACNNTTFNNVQFNAPAATSYTWLRYDCHFNLGNNPVINVNSNEFYIGEDGYSNSLTGTGTLTIDGGISHWYGDGQELVGFTGLVADYLAVNGTVVDYSDYTTLDLESFYIYGQAVGYYNEFIAPAVMSVSKNMAVFGQGAGGDEQVVFNHNNGTVILDGSNQTIGMFASTMGFTFYNLTKTVSAADTLTFVKSETQSVEGTLTLKGQEGAVLSLVSGNPGTQWNINPQGARDLAYLNVTDSNNINATFIQTGGLNITNGGNNTGWNFNYPLVTFQNMDNGQAVTTRRPQFRFNISDPDASNTVQYQIQVDGNSDFSSPVIDYTSALAAQGDFTFTPSTDLEDAFYFYRIRAIDSTGGAAGFVNANGGGIAFGVDLTGPTGSVFINPDAPSDNDRDVYLIFNATDNVSGVKDVIYSENADLAGASYTAYSTTALYTLSEGAGKKTIYVKFRDHAGNESATFSSTVDFQPQSSTPVTPVNTGTGEPDPGATYSVALLIVNKERKPLPNVKIRLANVEGVTDQNGVVVMSNIPAGEHQILGVYNDKEFAQPLEVGQDGTITIILEDPQTPPMWAVIILSASLTAIIVSSVFFVGYRRHKSSASLLTSPYAPSSQ